jgi:hypothetical protein
MEFTNETAGGKQVSLAILAGTATGVGLSFSASRSAVSQLTAASALRIGVLGGVGKGIIGPTNMVHSNALYIHICIEQIWLDNLQV